MKQFFSKLPGAFAAVSAVLLVGGTAALALSQAGSASDPLISQSYAQGEYRGQVAEQAGQAAAQVLDQSQAALEQKLDQIDDTEETLRQALARDVAAALRGDLLPASFPQGGTLSLQFGVELCLTSGSASLQSGELIDLTQGQALAAGGALVRSHLYLAPEQGAVVRWTSPVRVRIAGDYTQQDGSAQAYTPQYTVYADALSEIGLFSGGSAGYELDRASTRAEGLVMLLRLLGEAGRAASFQGTHPFTDVPAWADRYVAYAYAMGYTSGISDTQYGAQNTLTLRDYMTFLLRALGYDDSAGDFAWSTAGQTAVTQGILTEAHRAQIEERGVLYRDDMVYTSYQTLFVNCKDASEQLCDRLIRQGAFTRDALESAARLLQG